MSQKNYKKVGLVSKFEDSWLEDYPLDFLNKKIF